MFKRVLIFIRWPMLVVSLLWVASMAASGWYIVWFGLPIASAGTISVRLYAGGLMTYWVEGTSPRDPRWTVTYDTGWTRWNWFQFSLAKPPRWHGAAYPAWVVLAPLGMFAILGFRAKRLQAVAEDRCKGCAYLLKGLSGCPECGLPRVAPAPASKGDSD